MQTVDALAFVAEAISFDRRTQGLWCPWPGRGQWVRGARSSSALSPRIQLGFLWGNTLFPYFLNGISGESQLGARQNYYQESCLKTV